MGNCISLAQNDCTNLIHIQNIAEALGLLSMYFHVWMHANTTGPIIMFPLGRTNLNAHAKGILFSDKFF